MKLFSKEIDKKLFSQYSKGSDLDNQVVVTKIFNPYGNGRWFLINSDPQNPDYLWAIVQMGDVVEMGSVLRSELESVRVSPFRFPLERDLSFRMVNAGELFRGLQEGKFYKKGGWVDGYAKGGTTKDFDIDSLVGKKLDDGKIIRVEDLGNDNVWVVRENFSGLVIEQGFSKDDIIKLTKGEKVQGLQMMAKGGGIYSSDSLYYLQVIKDDKEVGREKFRAKSLKEAKEIAEEEYEEDYIKKYGNPLNFIVSEAMADGGKLIGNQKKLDVNKNGKLDAQDFKMLRKGKMAMGGETKFKDKVESIKASLLKRKKVAPKVQKDYGKTYSPKEAKESAQRIVGSMVSKMKEKVAKSKKK